jgi:hypothetical protein
VVEATDCDWRVAALALGSMPRPTRLGSWLILVGWLPGAASQAAEGSAVERASTRDLLPIELLSCARDAGNSRLVDPAAMLPLQAGADPWKVLRQMREKLRLNAAAVQVRVVSMGPAWGPTRVKGCSGWLGTARVVARPALAAGRR